MTCVDNCACPRIAGPSVACLETISTVLKRTHQLDVPRVPLQVCLPNTSRLGSLATGVNLSWPLSWLFKFLWKSATLVPRTLQPPLRRTHRLAEVRLPNNLPWLWRILDWLFRRVIMNQCWIIYCIVRKTMNPVNCGAGHAGTIADYCQCGRNESLWMKFEVPLRSAISFSRSLLIETLSHWDLPPKKKKEI